MFHVLIICNDRILLHKHGPLLRASQDLAKEMPDKVAKMKEFFDFNESDCCQRRWSWWWWWWCWWQQVLLMTFSLTLMNCLKFCLEAWTLGHFEGRCGETETFVVRWSRFFLTTSCETKTSTSKQTNLGGEPTIFQHQNSALFGNAMTPVKSPLVLGWNVILVCPTKSITVGRGHMHPDSCVNGGKRWGSFPRLQGAFVGLHFEGFEVCSLVK